MTADELKALIRVAFPSEPRPHSFEITDPGDVYWERVELRRELEGKSWPEVPSVILRRECGGELTWLSARGFRYYLPAWMIAALDEGNVLFGVLNALAPNERPDLHEFFLRHTAELDERQIAAVVAFLEFVSDQPDGRVVQTHDKDDAASSLVFWRQRAAR